jgi:Kef-type K+ transport system membrane component KefB
MTTGFCVENFSRYGENLIAAIERTSMTVYVIFFAIAGATINFSILRSVWLIALAFVVIRALAFGAGTAAAGLLCGESRLVTSRSWMGYLGQAGVSLGIANLVLKNFPDIGPRFYSIVIAAIAINQIVGPIALKSFLSKAGETAESRVEEGISLATLDTTEPT